MNNIISGALSKSDILPSKEELSARLGLPAYPEDEKVAKAISELLDVASPAFVATRVKILNISEGAVELEGISISSRALAKYFDGCKESYVTLVTLGMGVDRLIAKRRARSVADGFFYDAVASAMAEAAADLAESYIYPDVKTKNRFSPGYADSSLDIQRDIFALLSPSRHIGVYLLESNLMSPMKSVSAFAAVEEKI